MPALKSRKRPHIVPPLPQAGTRLGNGTAFLAGDGRTVAARRLKELVAGLLAEVTRLARQPTTQEELLARRAALLSIACEQTEAAMASGNPVDLDSYNTSTNTLRRCLADLGLIETRK